MATVNAVRPITGPEDMSGAVGHLITLAVVVLPAVVLAGFGLYFGNGNTAAGFAILWVALLVCGSIRFMRKRTYLVVERFGKLWDVKFAGLRFVIPFIDNPVARGDMLQKDVKLFVGEKEPIKIDFIGGSSPIDATAWYQVGNPEDIEQGDFEAVRRQVLKHTYLVLADDVPGRVAEIFQGAFRTFLESTTIPDAQKNMETLATAGTEAAREALAEIGVYPFPKKGIIVRDIDLPPELIELRERETRGQADAQEQINRSRGYWEPLVQMRNGLAAAPNGGVTMSDEAIAQFYLAQKGFETLGSTGANITLVGSNVKNVLATMTVGAKPDKEGD